ncbi:MAG: iron ABC transporter permease [Desulfuromusa sp.]|nr:iron ABC transporter permease [Desulfuromusa sp.]
MNFPPRRKTAFLNSYQLLLVLPLVFLGLFYFYPLIKIFILSFFPAGSFDQHEIVRFFTTPSYLKIVWFTCWQAALSTLLTLIVALPGAYIYAHYRFPGKNLVQILTTIPFVLPTVVVATAFRALLGHGGLLNTLAVNWLGFKQPPISLEQTLWFFLLAHIFYNYALVLRIVGSFWAGLAPELNHAASMLGASPWTTFRKITLPLLLPAIGSAALLVFIFCFTSFGVILILGGPGYATLEVEIYRQAVHLFNLPMAATLSLVQIIINFLLMWLHAKLGEKNNLTWFGSTGSRIAKTARSKMEKLGIAVHLIFVLSLLLTPMLALIVRSLLSDSGWTFIFYTALFQSVTDSLFYVPPFSAILNSVGFGIAAMTFALLLGLSASSYLALPDQRGKAFWDAIIMLPLATSAVTLGFGYIITLNKPPLNLRESVLLVILAHTLVAFPFVVRCLLPAIRQIPHSLREAAALLGASPRQIRMTIDLPLLSPAILVAAIFAFAISMGEFGASAFVTRPQTPTMPVAIFRFLSQPGEMNYGQAMAMSTILMVVTAAAFLLMEKLPNQLGER